MQVNDYETTQLLISTGKEIAREELKNEKAFLVHEHEGRTYIKGDWRPMLDAETDTLHVATLSGLKDFLESNPDNLDLDQLMVHVVDHETVKVRSIPVGGHKQRPVFLTAKALVPEHMFCKATRPAYYPPSVFIPYLQSCFAEVEGDDLKTVIRICGNVDVEANVNQKDDGMTQKVATRTGVVTKSEEEVPNPVILYPFSSFVEVLQPARKMVLRFAGNTDEGAGAALIEADGGAWKITAMQSIAEWLRKNLPEEVRVIA
ncbi:hypothetical protein [Halodesulfovibrio aestuarii]|uniref:hypothetical protein n=1 Tax=Halodesulfovibrio aestuarii TaxID=126333 RepID=UPI003D348125